MRLVIFYLLICSCSVVSEFDSKNMVLVDSGEFIMGSDQPMQNASPPHKVKLDAFFIGKTEMTGEIYKEIMGKDPSYYQGKNLPVERTSWIDAAIFCNELSKREGLANAYLVDETKRKVVFIKGSKGYRLPTEAEWEFAAIGGNKSQGYVYSGGNNHQELGWDMSNSEGRVHEVASKKPNELGIYDMDGNVSEWCFDGYMPYNNEDALNPIGDPSNGYKLVRGANWTWNLDLFGTKFRFTRDFDHRMAYYGFRIARSL